MKDTYKNNYNNLNHIYYRVDKRLNNLKSYKKDIMKTSFQNIINPDVFDFVKILSEPMDSGSGSLVFLLKSKKKGLSVYFENNVIRK